MSEEGFIERDKYEYEIVGCPLCDFRAESRLRRPDGNTGQSGRTNDEWEAIQQIGAHVLEKHAKRERRVKRFLVKTIDEPLVAVQLKELDEKFAAAKAQRAAE